MIGFPELRRLVRYLGGGLICAAAHNGVMLLADAAGLHYALANLLSLLSVGTLGYALHVRRTFEAAPSTVTYLRFMGGLLTLLPVSLGWMFLLSGVMALPMAIAAPVNTILMFLCNYVVARYTIMHSRA